MLYSRDNRELDLLLFWEVCDFVSRVDRVLSRPGGSLLLAGRSGVGRHTATSLVSHMLGYTLFTPKISRGYTLKQFSNDLKTVTYNFLQHALTDNCIVLAIVLIVFPLLLYQVFPFQI